VGSHLLKEALLRNHDVTAILRKPEKLGEKHKHLRVVKGSNGLPLPGKKFNSLFI
jgi:putative NADH-flavin reductase